MIAYRYHHPLACIWAGWMTLALSDLSMVVPWLQPGHLSGHFFYVRVASWQGRVRKGAAVMYVVCQRKSHHECACFLAHRHKKGGMGLRRNLSPSRRRIPPGHHTIRHPSHHCRSDFFLYFVRWNTQREARLGRRTCAIRRRSRKTATAGGQNSHCERKKTLRIP